MTTHNTCKCCGKQPAIHRTFARFSNIDIALFYTCSAECAFNVIHKELTKGVECIKKSLRKHALAECDCGSIQTDEYKE